MQKNILIYIGIFIFSTSAFAAQWATVLSEKAIIYADREMQVPIGFISKGKKVRVGEVKRNYGKLLPVVVQGKIAYIKVSDINSNTKLTDLQSAVERVKSGSKNVDSKRLSLIYSGYASFISINESESYTGETYKSDLFYFSGGGLRGYVDSDDKSSTWRVTLDHIATKVKDNEFRILFLTTEYGYNFLNYDNLTLRPYGGASLIPYSQYSYSSLFTVNGYGAGVSAGLELVLKFKNSIGLHFDGNYQYSKLFYRLPSQTNIDKYEPSFNGIKFTAGVSFSF